MKKRMELKRTSRPVSVLEELKDMLGIVYAEAPAESTEECDENED